MLHSSELVRPFHVVNSHWDTSGENSEKKIHRATPLNSEEPNLPEQHRRPSTRDLSSRRDCNRRWFEDRPGADP